jgi:hypothetical protein
MQEQRTNQNELRVIGMSRSGNHAIINWIINQIPGRYCFLNCAEPKTNPFVSARPLMHDDAYLANYSDFDLAAEQVGRFSTKDYFIHSYEDCLLGMVASPAFEDQHDRFVGPSARRLDILILRDPFNLFASRERSRVAHVSVKTAVRIWKQHAGEFLGKRRYLNQRRILISYNAWVSESSYRRRLAGELGLRFTDAGFRSISHFAPASSFDGRVFHARADEMRVLHRWRHLVHEPAYRTIFDADMVALSNAIFGRFHEAEKAMLSPRWTLQQAF